jgi:hypothetical protein
LNLLRIWVGSLNFEHEEVEKVRNVSVLRFLDIHSVAHQICHVLHFSALFLADHVFPREFLFFYIYPGVIISSIRIILDGCPTLYLIEY